MGHIYDTPLSDGVKLMMHKLLKHSSAVVQGFIFFRHRTITKAYYDKEACDALLKALVINQDNVLNYLRRKYIPTWTATGCIFRDQNCIQKVIIREDKTLFMHIKNSEPHKVITDTVHIMSLLKEHGFDFIPEIKYYIEQIKLAVQDMPLYNVTMAEFGYKIPTAAKIYEKQLMKKFPTLESIVCIKKRSVKRKFLRYLVKIEKIIWSELRDGINVTDFSPRNIKVVCDKIRAGMKERGVKVDI